jgi:hypothetical protein
MCASERTSLSDGLFVCFGEIKKRLLQPQIPLAAFFVVRQSSQGSTRCGLSSEAFGGPHTRASDSSASALQHFVSRDAIMFVPQITISS